MAVQSRVLLGGERSIWGEAGVGVVATQDTVDVSYGPKAIARLKAGHSPQARGGLAPGPRILTPGGKGGRRRGASSLSWMPVETWPPIPAPWQASGPVPNRDILFGPGQLLAGPAVVEEMVKAFEETEGHLSYRLLAALDAGQAAGGDTRGMQSAAMLIVKKGGGVWLNNDVVLRLQVDDAENPFVELRRLVDIAARQRGATRRR